MKSINNRLANQRNVGSIRRILFLPTESLNSIPLLTDGVLDLRDVTIAGWYYSEMIIETGSLNEAAEYATQGRMYKDEVTWKVARDLAERVSNFTEMLSYEFFVAVQDTNDEGRFYGSINIETGEKKGMRFSFKKTTDDKYPGLNHYELKFFMESNLAPIPCDHFSTVTRIEGELPSDPID